MLYEVSDRVRSLLHSSQAPELDDLRQLASEYSSAVNRVNLRLRACAALLAQQRQREAVALATSQPDLIDLVAALDFTFVDQFNQLLQTVGVCTVETPDTRIALKLHNATLKQQVAVEKHYQIPPITVIGFSEQLTKYAVAVRDRLRLVLPEHFGISFEPGVLNEPDEFDLLSFDAKPSPGDDRFAQELSHGVRLKCDLGTSSNHRKNSYELSFAFLTIEEILDGSAKWEDVVDGPFVLMLDECSRREGRFRPDIVIHELAAHVRKVQTLQSHQPIASTLVLCCQDAELSRRFEAELRDEVPNAREAVYGSLNVPIIQRVSESMRTLMSTTNPQVVVAADGSFSNVMYVPIDYEVDRSTRATFTPDIPVLYSTHALAPNLIAEPVQQPSSTAPMVSSDVNNTHDNESKNCQSLDVPVHRGNHSGMDVSKYDPVDCAVFAPPQVSVGQDVLIQVFVYRPSEAELTKKAATEFDDEAGKRGTRILGAKVPHGATITFGLSFESLNKVLGTESIVWRGEVESVQFSLSVDANERPRTIVGRLTAMIDSVPFGEIKFKLKITADAADSRLRSVGQASRYTQAFISYASKDRPCVQSQLGILTAAGIKYFQDVIDLEPGDRWEKKLYEKIHKSDVMFLFWSTAAKKSEWVEKEWRYALLHKGTDYIRPVIIEGPPIPDPPAELNFMHFDDKLRYFIKALERTALES